MTSKVPNLSLGYVNLRPVPFPHERHSHELRDAVGAAILKGSTATSVVRELAAGTFEDFGVYVLPLPTARDYGQKARKREAATGLTKRAKGDLDDAITQMARELLSEYDMELTAARAKKTRDLEKLGTIVKGLKDLRGLIVTGKGTAANAKTPAKPRDSFAASLEKASNTKATRAMSSEKKEKDTSDGPSLASQREAEEPPSGTENTIEVPSRVAGWPVSGPAIEVSSSAL